MSYHAKPARASELKDGIRVEYRGSWGRDLPVNGVIVGEPHIEANDQLSFGVRLDFGGEKWGYADQFSIIPEEPGILFPTLRPWSKTVCDYVGECAAEDVL